MYTSRFNTVIHHYITCLYNLNASTFTIYYNTDQPPTVWLAVGLSSGGLWDPSCARRKNLESAAAEVLRWLGETIESRLVSSGFHGFGGSFGIETFWKKKPGEPRFLSCFCLKTGWWFWFWVVPLLSWEFQVLNFSHLVPMVLSFTITWTGHHRGVKGSQGSGSIFGPFRKIRDWSCVSNFFRCWLFQSFLLSRNHPMVVPPSSISRSRCPKGRNGHNWRFIDLVVA